MAKSTLKREIDSQLARFSKLASVFDACEGECERAWRLPDVEVAKRQLHTNVAAAGHTEVDPARPRALAALEEALFNARELKKVSSGRARARVLDDACATHPQRSVRAKARSYFSHLLV